MTTEVRWRRGTTAQHATFTGALGEVTVDTDQNSLVVHDGLTPGGFRQAAGSFIQPGAGAVQRGVADRILEEISVKDFGAKGDGVTDDTTAFKSAIAYLQTNGDHRGGVLRVPRGVYKLSDTLAFTQYATGLVHNTYMKGDGPNNTVLDFQAVGAGVDGVSWGYGNHFGIEDLTIQRAKGHGLFIGKGNINDMFSSQFLIRNVRVQMCGGDGVRFGNCFMGIIDRVWSWGHTANAFHLAGFHTSMNFNACGGNNSTLHGWRINSVVYSTFNGCGADENVLDGYNVSNAQGVTFNGCGAESNKQNAWSYFTSNAVSTGVIPSVQNIGGVVMSGCFTVNNNLANSATNAVYVKAVTADSRPISINIVGGAVNGAQATDKTFVLNGTSGRIDVRFNGLNTSAITTASVKTGTTYLRNQGMSGYHARATLPTASQDIPNGGAQNKMVLAMGVDNDLGATVVAGEIVIPKDVYKVRVSASAAFALNPTGVRQLAIYKNGALFGGGPQAQAPAVSGSATLIQASAQAWDVLPGDKIGAYVFQNSGGVLGVVQATETMLVVEAIG